MTEKRAKLSVISTNIGERTVIHWKNKTFTTGIFKQPTSDGIYLGKEDVVSDHVIDRKYHGGVDKACYIYPLDHYAYWKQVYPELDWELGMFGENLTIEGFNEMEICIGDVFKIGSAIIQISEARQPCSTLNMRFNSSKMVKDFVQFGYCGAYVRVLEEGKILPGDTMELISSDPAQISIHELFQALYPNNSISKSRYEQMLELTALGAACRSNLKEQFDLMFK